MNPLIDRLPDTLAVAGKVYPIDADFRTCLRIIQAFEDQDLSPAERQGVMIDLLYKTRPDDLLEAAKQAVLFLNCGEEEGEGSSESASRLYSFTHDARFIYTAICQTHRIDLTQVDFLHWWKFCCLFMDLREDCFFSRLVYLRRQKQRGKLTREEREAIDGMRSVFELPTQVNSEERAEIDEFMKALKGG